MFFTDAAVRRPEATPRPAVPQNAMFHHDDIFNEHMVQTEQIDREIVIIGQFQHVTDKHFRR